MGGWVGGWVDAHVPNLPVPHSNPKHGIGVIGDKTKAAVVVLSPPRCVGGWVGGWEKRGEIESFLPSFYLSTYLPTWVFGVGEDVSPQLDFAYFSR